MCVCMCIFTKCWNGFDSFSFAENWNTSDEIGRLLPSHLPKNWKASCKERCVNLYVHEVPKVVFRSLELVVRSVNLAQ